MPTRYELLSTLLDVPESLVAVVEFFRGGFGVVQRLAQLAIQRARVGVRFQLLPLQRTQRFGVSQNLGPDFVDAVEQARENLCAVGRDVLRLPVLKRRHRETELGVRGELLIDVVILELVVPTIHAV